MKTYSISSLNGEAYETALKTVNLYLKGIGIQLDTDDRTDRQRIAILSINLNIKFNEIGGLA